MLCGGRRAHGGLPGSGHTRGDLTTTLEIHGRPRITCAGTAPVALTGDAPLAPARSARSARSATGRSRGTNRTGRRGRARNCGRRGGEIEGGGHVRLQPAVGVHMRPEQWGQRPSVRTGEAGGRRVSSPAPAPLPRHGPRSRRAGVCAPDDAAAWSFGCGWSQADALGRGVLCGYVAPPDG
ncbi:predicted protein [Streptomyces viridosporus ATCC 14672]|uniref:Predicted protein n=1 Tax=Streptomyces viridosporus (strain ATCC 14672 / DSM 40746 / JCM 4963 / KCTC 9882 / NRRL B-12104 / FH 1290) TaxID=566461 RepID=D6AAJ8_STRV1|nr:predicted protein [Streptomyces viridosporus ATCC 14672]